jgi:hypothetical protein
MKSAAQGEVHLLSYERPARESAVTALSLRAAAIVPDKTACELLGRMV